jgi:hypothetical protein
MAAVARELGRVWDTVNSIAVEATRTLLLSDKHPARGRASDRGRRAPLGAHPHTAGEGLCDRIADR